MQNEHKNPQIENVTALATTFLPHPLSFVQSESTHSCETASLHRAYFCCALTMFVLTNNFHSLMNFQQKIYVNAKILNQC